MFVIEPMILPKMLPKKFKMKLLVNLFIIFLLYPISSWCNNSDLEVIPKQSKYFGPNSPCNWIYSHYCFILCESTNSLDLPFYIEEQFYNNHSCKYEPITLKLSNITFDESKLYIDWNMDTVFMNLTNLEISMSNLKSINISPNAFSSIIYSNLRKLELYSIRTPLLENGTFNGLVSLKELEIRHSIVERTTAGFLGCVNNTLQKMVYTQVVNSQPYPSDVAPITGSISLPALKSIRIHDNLKNTLNSTTFKGLVSIEILDLSDCQIETIGLRTFDLVSQTLISLILKDNMISHLPSGLFHSFLNRTSHYTIYIGNNPWNCNCELTGFQLDVLGEINFSGQLNCAAPNCVLNKPLMEINVCVSDITEDACTNDDPDFGNRNFINIDCYDEQLSESELLELRKNQIKNITTNDDGDVVIQLVERASDSVIIWFASQKTLGDTYETYYQSSDDVECQSSDTQEFIIRNLTALHTYTICVMNKYETTISPLDCIPYYKHGPDLEGNIVPWILESEKMSVITWVTCGAVLSLIFGIVLAYFLIRNNPTWLRGNKRVVRVSNASNSDVMIMPPEWEKSSRASVISNNTQSGRRRSDVSIISGKSNRGASKTSPSTVQHKGIDTENKYYLDYLPHKSIPPPLPPPNLPPVLQTAPIAPSYYDLNDAPDQQENYYSVVNPKKH